MNPSLFATLGRHWLLAVGGALGAFALYLGLYSQSLTLRPFAGADVLRLLGSLGVVALLVERTIEVSIGAWRGKVTDRLFSAAESAKLAMISAPANPTLHETVMLKQTELADYRAETRKLALRAAILLGLLVAAAGFRTMETLVVPVTAAGPVPGLFRILDLLMTAAIIGGGSEPIHRMISMVTNYLDSIGRTVRAGETGGLTPNMLVAAAGVPAVTPGPPKL
jgi:hypothetical protein